MMNQSPGLVKRMVDSVGKVQWVAGRGVDDVFLLRVNSVSAASIISCVCQVPVHSGGP